MRKTGFSCFAILWWNGQHTALIESNPGDGIPG
jgi:hypothetical protein